MNQRLPRFFSHLVVTLLLGITTIDSFSQFTNVNLTNQARPQNEPSVRISRVNSNNIVAAFRDFRLGYAGTNPARRIGYVYSNNGGQSWSTSTLLPAPQLPYVTQSDPVVTSDASGNFYISSVSRKSNKPGKEENDIIVYRSTNNGQTFSFLSVAIATPKPCKSCNDNGEDKEWMICDPVTTSPTYNNILLTSTRQLGWNIRFVKSTNGGTSWTAPAQVSDASNSGSGSNLAVGTDGHIYVVWVRYPNTGIAGIRFDKSTDGGVSFGTDVTLSTYALQGIRVDGGPFICVDYSQNTTRGNVYVAWSDTRDGTQDVWLQRSTNSGSMWLTNPIRVNDVATGSQYKPIIQCDENGILWTLFYDTRLGGVNSYMAYSTDAGDTWTNVRVSSTSFTGDPINGDVRFGEYVGIDAFAGKVIPVWTDDRAGAPNQEVYTANIVGIPKLAQRWTSGSRQPGEFVLHQNYPNPFGVRYGSSSTTISFSLPEKSRVYVNVYDPLGREVAQLAQQEFEAGQHSIQWTAHDKNGKALPSGVYTYKLIAVVDGVERVAVRRMVVVR